MKLQPREITRDEPVKKSEEGDICTGGLILADETGNITFKATLDSRLNILKEMCLPVIREIIWPDKK
jgi:vacuolar-type H+-ATPase subunit E/Vma4